MAANRHNARPVPLADLLGRWSQGRGLSRSGEFRAVASAWERVVPEAIAARARPFSFRGGRLVVAVASAPLLSELQCFRASEFLPLLNRALAGSGSGVTVRQVEFRRL